MLTRDEFSLKSEGPQPRRDSLRCRSGRFNDRRPPWAYFDRNMEVECPDHPSVGLAQPRTTLETRQVLSTVTGPTPDQQYALELINLVRTNPSAAAENLTANISPDVKATLTQRRPDRRWPQERDGFRDGPAAPRLERRPRRLGPAAEPVRGQQRRPDPPGSRRGEPDRPDRLRRLLQRQHLRREHLRLRRVDRRGHAIVPLRLGRRRPRPLQQPAPARDLGLGTPTRTWASAW